jgi:SAM-dependent methyltransferase
MLFKYTPKLKEFRSIFERHILARLYGLASNVICPYCNWTGWRFLPAGAGHVPNRLCPRCGSLQRYRMLLLYLQREKALENSIRMLDVAPRTCFSNYIQQIDNITYLSSDLDSASSMVWSDLTQMGMDDNVFDLIVCFHVLEHVADDQAAFSELGRLLKPRGFGLLMVPVRGNATFELSGVHPDEFVRLYGQHDHVRLYGMDIAERMRSAGLVVEVLDMFQLFGRDVCQRYALYGDDRYVFRFSK